MSRITIEQIACPACSVIADVRIYSSVNVSLDPELRELVLTNQVNSFLCVNCGQKTMVHGALLYHDMTRRYAVWYMPAATEAEMRELADGLAQDDVISGDYLRHPRIEPDWMEFKNYILTNDQAIDEMSRSIEKRPGWLQRIFHRK